MVDPSLDPGGVQFTKRAILSILLEFGSANSKMIATILFGPLGYGYGEQKTSRRIVKQLLRELEDEGEIAAAGRHVWKLT